MSNTDVLQVAVLDLVEEVPERPWDTELFGEDLDARAADELGYSGLQKVLEKSTQQSKLLKAFHACGISPYTTESVERYMEQAAKKANGSIFPRFFSQFGRDDVVAIFGLVAISFLLAATVGGIGSMFGFIPLELVGVNVAGVFVCACILVLASCFIPPLKPMTFVWRTDAIGHYILPIPDFALHKALLLKRECPEVSFTIHSLVKEGVMCDPILSASYEHKRYYLAVWGEPSFTGERENEVEPVT